MCADQTIIRCAARVSSRVAPRASRHSTRVSEQPGARLPPLCCSSAAASDDRWRRPEGACAAATACSGGRGTAAPVVIALTARLSKPRWRPQRSIEPLHESCTRHSGHTERAETRHKRHKGGSEGCKWTPKGGQGWSGDGGCGRARHGGVKVLKQQRVAFERLQRAERRAVYLRRVPEARRRANRRPAGRRPGPGPMIPARWAVNWPWQEQKDST